MKHLKLFLALFALIGVNLTANAQTDVTSQYITNADFEGEYKVYSNPSSDRAIYQPTGWTVTYSNGDSNDMTSLNSSCSQWGQFSGKPQPSNGGNNAYWIRFRWGNSESLQLSQTVTLPAGDFLLSADAFFNGSSADATISAAGLSKQISGNNIWQNYSVSFTLNEETEVTLAVKLVQKSTVESIAAFDNFKLIKLDGITETNPMLTDFVVNGTFNSNVSGWQHSAEVWSNNIASNQAGDFTGNFYENWDGTAKVNKMYQTINNIPNGTYKLKIAAFVNNLADPNESQFVFANNDKTYLTTGSPTFYEVWTVVTNNTVEIGLEQTTATANWMGIDNVSLTYYGAGDVIDQAQNAGHKADWDAALAAAQAAVANTDYANVTGSEKTDLQNEIDKDEPTTAEGYDEATAALVSATNAFIAAKLNYDALVAEIAKAKALGIAEDTANGYAATSTTTAETALTNTQNLKVVEYNYVTTTYQYGVKLGEWTSTGTNTRAADFNNEHWSGTTHEYKNQDDNDGQGWNASSWSINFSQDVTLPAGSYVFKVAGRQATGDQVNTSLIVKVNGTELGSVSDFPRGNAARGINKEGVTSFTENNDAYANNGNGYGWEWRYVKFTLTEEATVNIAINSVATASHMWVSFGDYTVQTDDDANISMIAYNIALNDAKNAQDNEVYANVTGEEKTALENAIAADPGTTKESIDAATEALKTATAAFTAAKAAYDGFVAAKSVETPELKYAAASKKQALTEEKAVENATSKADAETKTAAITTALRAYYESHALAEGVDGALRMTIDDPNMEVEYDGTEHTFGAWQVFGQTDGTISLKTKSDEPLTDSEGNKYNYADIWKSDNNGGIKQSVNLAPGKYMLTAAARAQDTNGATFGLFAGTERIEIPRISSTGGVFGNGWNDVSVEFLVTTQSDVEIGVQSGNGKTMWWSATRFRLVKIAELDPVSITIKAGRQYTAFSSNKALDFTNSDLKAQIVISETGTTRDVTKVPANTGIIVGLAEAAAEATIIEVPVCADETDDVTDNMLVAVVDGANIMRSNQDYTNYVFGKKNGKEAFYKIPTEGIDVPANNAYLAVPTASGAKEVIFLGGETTGISNVDADAETGEFYNLSGVKVKKAQKGVYIQNGKKVIVK